MDVGAMTKTRGAAASLNPCNLNCEAHSIKIGVFASRKLKNKKTQIVDGGSLKF